MTFYPETVSDATKKVLDKIKHRTQLEEFYLSGGAAFALQLDHRESEDLETHSGWKIH